MEFSGDGRGRRLPTPKIVRQGFVTVDPTAIFFNSIGPTQMRETANPDTGGPPLVPSERVADIPPASPGGPLKRSHHASAKVSDSAV